MPENLKSSVKTSRRGSVHIATRDVNGVDIEQRQTDGFINGTAMSVAHGKDLNDWFTTRDSLELFSALADDLQIEIKVGDFRDLDVSRLSASKYAEIFPGLVFSKRGSPSTGGGTWLHPDLAIQLAQWCNKPFAIQVGRWIREWMTSAYNPIQLEADADRVAIRDDLGKVKRLELTDQVKYFLQKTGKYDLSNPKTRFYFSNAHDQLNKVITGETSKEMRFRLSKELNREVSEEELIRDYFPIKDLVNYANLCQAAANEMERNGTSVSEAIDIAVKLIFPSKFAPKQIIFTERIDLVRRRLEQRDQLLLGGAIPILGEIT
jgi:KilA-N domain